MSNELLPLLDILAGPPKNADHADTIVAVNGHGGSLPPHDLSLNPNLNPNLNPQPHPQTNGAAAAANGHDAATADDSPAPVSAGLADGLARVAVTIRQIESVLKANGALGLEVHFAIERIQDVVMALRMREVDAALCDTLEASVREVGDAIIRNDAAAARTQSAAALLCDLGKRIDHMLPPVARAALVEPDQADKADKADPVAGVAAASDDHATKPNGAAARPMAATGVVAADDDHADPLPQPVFAHPALPDMELSAAAKQQPARPAAPVALLMPSPLGENDDVPSDHAPVDQQAEARDSQAIEQIAAEPPVAVAPDDEQAPPPAATSAPLAAATNGAAPSAGEPNGAAPSAGEPNGAAANSRASANDPLAAIYGLSEEELIALFS